MPHYSIVSIEGDDLSDSFIVVARSPYHGAHLQCLLSNTIRQMNTGEMQLIM
jgi:hypothetical protein